MMDKRLLALVPEAMRHVILAVAWKWAGLLSNICLVWGVASVLAAALEGTAVPYGMAAILIAVACVGKAISVWAQERESLAASQDVKRKLRRAILEKLLRLGPAYDRQASTAEVVQLSVEGCEQLETYFGQYLPQIFYSVLAPVTLFVVIAPMDLAAAIVLLVFCRSSRSQSWLCRRSQSASFLPIGTSTPSSAIPSSRISKDSRRSRSMGLTGRATRR